MLGPECSSGPGWRRLDDELVQLALCDGDRDRCASPAALRLLAIVDTARARDGRSRLGEINRAINLAIRPMSDLAQYGQIDVWSSPLETFASGAGDCEDYAIAKFVASDRPLRALRLYLGAFLRGCYPWRLAGIVLLQIFLSDRTYRQVADGAISWLGAGFKPVGPLNS